MSEEEIVEGIRSPGRFDADVESREEAERLIRRALPHAQELPAAIAGAPYPPPPPGVDAWFQAHPAEHDVGHAKPHVKYVDWTKGKKGRGGSWGTSSSRQRSRGVTMSVMFEVYYQAPADAARESDLSRAIEALGGRLDFREPAERSNGAIVLTYEFDDWGHAEDAARLLRARGEHVEGPQEYAA